MNKTALFITLAAAITLSGCAAPAAQEPSPKSSIEFSIPDPLPADVTASGVVLAGVLLTSGDIVKAVEQGLVSPTEVELAQIAIEAGNLNEWSKLANSLISK